LTQIDGFRTGRDGRATPLEALAGSGFVRLADARQSDGNRIELLRDGPQTFPRWLDAIDQAERTVHLENYILQEDAVGGAFADALIRAAQRGVRCRVLYDWLGCRRRTSKPFWERLRRSGIEVRCYNPPALWHPLIWISRDHRKVLCVDGRVGFTGGLCIGHDWMGDPARGIPPWRDTAIAIEGPAVADLEATFADSWKHEGGAPEDMGVPDNTPESGTLKAWVIAGVPNSMGLYRLEQLVAEIAERSLWLTDAYFAATTGYVHALCGAARAGVDVRLLVPGSSNFPVVRALSLAEYRPLLEAGVRVFEWNGPMLHAKTAVSDGCWSRVGSSNSNLASWITNRELDITIHDRDFARQMEEMYERDLENATEIVLQSNSVRSVAADKQPSNKGVSAERGDARRGRLLAGTVGIGSSVGATLIGRRTLGPAESGMLAAAGAVLAALGIVALIFPPILAYPFGLVAAWLGSVLLIRAWNTRNGRSRTKTDQ
jgi:cardiolipin synthase